MIKMTYDPILGVRYIISDDDPRPEIWREPHNFSKFYHQYCKACSARINQSKRKNNTKSK